MKKQDLKYPFDLRPLSEDEGGGWLITFPDIPGCMSDGETPEEAIKNGRDALGASLAALQEWGRPLPEPGAKGASGKFPLRLPKSLHARLAARAEVEGVSMNTMAVTILAGGLGQHGEEPTVFLAEGATSGKSPTESGVATIVARNGKKIKYRYRMAHPVEKTSGSKGVRARKPTGKRKSG